jgi:hypothetical protein
MNDQRPTTNEYYSPVDPSLSPRRTLKRGALVAAANWPIIVIQASSDAVFKVVVALPVVGGIVLAALVIGAEPGALLALDVRDMGTTVFALLTARPGTLAVFIAAVGTAVVGVSVLAFLVKAGTVAIVVVSEREVGPVEEPQLDAPLIPVRPQFSVEQFNTAVRRFGPRFVRLGCGLLATYLVSGIVYFLSVFRPGASSAWAGAAAATALLVVWITIVNLLYLLTQVVVVAEDCGVLPACRRVVVLMTRAWPAVARVCVLVLAIVAGATSASLLATAALGLVAFVPFFWLAVLPLQLAAWVVRALVQQFIALGAVAAYASVYRNA